MFYLLFRLSTVTRVGKRGEYRECMERIGKSTVWDKRLGAGGWDIETREEKKNNINILKQKDQQGQDQISLTWKQME